MNENNAYTPDDRVILKLQNINARMHEMLAELVQDQLLVEFHDANGLTKCNVCGYFNTSKDQDHAPNCFHMKAIELLMENLNG